MEVSAGGKVKISRKRKHHPRVKRKNKVAKLEGPRGGEDETKSQTNTAKLNAGQKPPSQSRGRQKPKIQHVVKIRDLPLTTTKEDLRNIFEKCAPVTEINFGCVVHQSGTQPVMGEGKDYHLNHYAVFAYVKFETPYGVAKAMELDGKVVEGLRLDMLSEGRSENSDKVSRMICVQLDEDKPKSFRVVFKHEESVANALRLSGSNLNNSPIFVRQYVNKGLK